MKLERVLRIDLDDMHRLAPAGSGMLVASKPWAPPRSFAIVPGTNCSSAFSP
jgi:hypothetical protein